MSKHSCSWAVMLASLTGSTMVFAAPSVERDALLSDSATDFTLSAILGDAGVNATFKSRVHKLQDQEISTLAE